MASPAELRARTLQLQAQARQKATQEQVAKPAKTDDAYASGKERTRAFWEGVGLGGGYDWLVRQSEAAGKRGEDVGRSVASGMTFGLADEAAAGLSSMTGVGAQPGGEGTYESNLAAERARDREIPAAVAIPGQVAGAVLTGTGLASGGLTLLNAAKPTMGSMAARGAAEGAAYGGLYGAGSAEGGAQERAEGAMWGAFLGGLTGGAVGAVTGKVAQKAAEKAVPTTQQIFKEGGKAYDRASASGVTLTQSKFDQIADDIYRAGTKATNEKLTPKVYGALDEFEKLRGTTPTLSDIDVLRQTLRTAQDGAGKKELARLQGMINQLDDALERLTPADVVAGNVAEGTAALKEARALWSRGSKAETIEKLIRRAETRAGQYSGSGMENALRTEFRQLAMNDKKMRLFTPEEQQAIKLVSQGAPLTNVMRYIGKAAPTGIVSSGVGIGTTAAFGPWGMALPAAGIVGRGAATGLTKGAANRAALTMRAGQGGIPQAAPMSPAQVNAMRSFLLAPVPAEAQAVNALRPSNRAR